MTPRKKRTPTRPEPAEEESFQSPPESLRYDLTPPEPEPDAVEDIPRTLHVPSSGADRAAFIASLLKSTLGKEKAKRRKTRASAFELVIPADFQLTPEFSHAFDVMENTNENVFITGRAGTGKSTLLQYFRSKTKKNFVVLAPTGVAAVNVGGATIHSFFRFPPRLLTGSEIRRVPEKSKVFAGLETLIIDEVSMVRADVMEAIDIGLRINRGKPASPFGGVQVILIGDLYQLPPVIESAVQEHFEENFGTGYFFSAPAISRITMEKIELGRIFRQEDAEFIRLLNNVRNATVSSRDLQSLNDRYMPDYTIDEDDVAITLTATNDRANSINSYRLKALGIKERVYESSVTGTFEEKLFPTDQRLALKEGAQVMMLRNDPQKRWVNGSLGIIHRLSQEVVEVSINGEIFAVEQATWEKVDYNFDATMGRIEPVVLGTFRQYPMKLAWAITIHKSQGKTFDRVLIDFGRGAFTSGQAYVALSRCRTLEGIRLLTPIRHRDIMVDEVIKVWHERKM